MSTFVHLHNHTEYSLLDGAARISKLVKTAKEQGSPAVAITDHGNMYGAYKFYKECKKQGIKGIIGCEVYMVDDLASRISTEHRGHLVLLAKNNDGYINLCKINSKAWTEGFYYKPRIDYNFLAQHSEGLICLSGCLAGHIPHLLMQGMIDEAKKYATRLKTIFKEDFYIELQDHGLPEQKEVTPKLIQVANDLGIELVATNDVHYIYADDAEMQDALMCIEMRKIIDDPDRMKFPTDQFYVKTHDEMSKLFKNIAPTAISNTVKIAEKCNCHPFEKAQLMPEFKKEGVTNNVAYLRQLIEEGLIKKYGKITPEIKERYETELRVIDNDKQSFVDYFLVVADFMNFANSKGIAVGPGRGSGAGSIIAYALNITLLDPLRYGLLFERFLHSERVSSPDFDLDFCCNRRGEVIDYVIEKYGNNKVCQIVTFGTLAAKAAIKDIARVFKMPYSEVEAITKPISFNQQVRPPILPYVFDLKNIKDPKLDKNFESLDEEKKEKALEEFRKEKDKLAELRKPELISLYQNNPDVKKIVDMAIKVEGFPRNCSTHAAGVIICKKVVGDVTPLQKNGNDITSQFDMKEVEELGMLKMDFLGLITLTDIQGALIDIKAQLGKTVDFYNMQYDDQEVYRMITEGDTDAVFQLESGGFKSFMKQLKPDCIEDIIAGVALFRPGPMDMIPNYCRNKHNPELTKYDHPLLEPILKETYGQIVYQEQVMDIFKFLGGYSLGQADNVRRAMGKKDIKEMDRQRDIFLNGDPNAKGGPVKGAIANGVSKEKATLIFDKMQKFAGYAFNKSHAACYAFIAYQTAYLKHYYYHYYMASVLNNRVHKWDDMTHYINLMSARGVRMLPPSINKSGAYFTVEKTESGENAIRFGLAALKNVGTSVVESILSERANKGTFKSFQDFCSRVELGVLNKRCLDSLILSGAFDELKAARSQLMTVYPSIVKLLSTEKKAADSGQISMFGELLKDDSAADVKLPEIAEYDQPTKLKFEKEVVGMYLSGHPLQQYSNLFNDFSFNTGCIKRNTAETEEDADTTSFESQTNETEQENTAVEFTNNSPVRMLAIIMEIKRVLTRASKKEMAIVRVEDLFGSCEVMIPPGPFEKYRSILNKDAAISISGKLSMRDGEDPIVMADKIELLFSQSEANSAVQAPKTETRAKTLYLRYNTADQDLHSEIQAILDAYSGTIPVVVKCIATSQVLSPRMKIRDCQAIIYELASVLGEENVIMK